MGETQTKRLLRAATAGLLPDAVRLHWPKQGFRPPQELWFAEGPLLAAAQAAIEDDGFDSTGWWNRRWWRSVLNRCRAGESHLAWVLWRPFIAEAWRRHFVAPCLERPREAVRD
jgi:asparagine synthase (glutamine-hydrolysing)